MRVKSYLCYFNGGLGRLLAAPLWNFPNDFPREPHEGLHPWILYLLHWTYGSHLYDQPQSLACSISPHAQWTFHVKPERGTFAGPLYVLVSQSDWQQTQTPTIRLLIVSLDGNCRAAFLSAIKFWTFAKLVQVLWTLASCRITGNWFLSSFRKNLVEILFILFHVWVVFCYSLDEHCLHQLWTSPLPSYRWINCWWRREDWECLL